MSSRADTFFDDLRQCACSVAKRSTLDTAALAQAMDEITRAVATRWGGEMIYLPKRSVIRARQQTLYSEWQAQSEKMPERDALKVAARRSGYTVSHAKRIIRRFQAMPQLSKRDG